MNKIFGIATIDPPAAGEDLDVVGSATIEHPDARFGNLKVNGTLTAQAVRAASGDIKGRADVRGDLFINNTIDLTGTLVVTGTFTTGTCDFTGGVTLRGSTIAKHFVLHLDSPSSADTIQAESVTVDSRRGTLKVKSIEAKDVDVSFTDAEVVRGERVIVGPHCRIGLVEYSVSLVIDPESRVTNQVKV